jgi:hypothetical protein
MTLPINKNISIMTFKTLNSITILTRWKELLASITFVIYDDLKR